jgi:hypothetical protein
MMSLFVNENCMKSTIVGKKMKIACFCHPFYHISRIARNLTVTWKSCVTLFCTSPRPHIDTFSHDDDLSGAFLSVMGMNISEHDDCDHDDQLFNGAEKSDHD